LDQDLISNKFKKFFLFIFLIFIAVFVLILFKNQLATTKLEGELLILISLSVLLNLGVIIYHYKIPPHPKFLILPKRKWTIRLHVWSGTIELISGVISCYFLSPKAALVQGCAALFLHVPTALLQTPVVFGSKAIMIPSYLLCIIIHGFCAFQLIQDPSSHAWAINTFLIFNVYAWCRFYFYMFDRFHLFGNEKYSVAILLAGLTIIPSMFGALSLLILVSYISLFILMVKIFFIRTPIQYFNFIHERSRDALLNSDFIKNNVKTKDIECLRNESERDKAEYVFKLLDLNKKNFLGHVELAELLSEWGLSKGEVQDYFTLLGTKKVNFDLFFHKMAPIWKYIYFDILRAQDKSESNEMIGRSLDSLRSSKKITELKKDIEINLLKNTPFLKDAEPKLVEDLAASLLVKEMEINEILFHEGDPGDRFYLIGKGEVSIFKSNEFITTLSSGACVGEMALIENRPRNATIICHETCLLYSLSKSSFDYVLNTYPHLKEELYKLIRDRQK